MRCRYPATETDGDGRPEATQVNPRSLGVPIAAGTGAALGLLFGLLLNEVILGVAFGIIAGALVGRLAAAVR